MNPGDIVRLTDTDAVNAGDDPTGVVVGVTADGVAVRWTEYDTVSVESPSDLVEMP